MNLHTLMSVERFSAYVAHCWFRNDNCLLYRDSNDNCLLDRLWRRLLFETMMSVDTHTFEVFADFLAKIASVVDFNIHSKV